MAQNKAQTMNRRNLVEIDNLLVINEEFISKLLGSKEQQLVLVSKILIERRPRNVRGLGNISQSGRFVALGRE